MSGKKLIVIGIAGIILLGGFLPVHAAELKIACVDMQRAVKDCSAGKDLSTMMDREMERAQRLDADKQKEILALKEAYEKQASMLTPDARASREKELQKKVREYQAWQEDTKNDLQRKSTALNKIVADVRKVIDKVGADENYTLILVKSDIVPYCAKNIDITDKIIKLVDAQKK